MESRSKIQVGPDTLAGICRRYLGTTMAASREIADGWFNTIHVLELVDGRRAVLKVSPDPGFVAMRYERGILDTEVEVHGCLAEAGLRVPRVLAKSSGDEAIPHPWFIMEWLDGVPLGQARASLDAEASASLDRQVASQAARVNAMGGARFGRWQEDRCASSRWSDSFGAMVEDLLADARDKSVALPMSEDDLFKVLDAARDALDGVRTPRLVLWDLHDGNVMVRPGSAELAGFLDTDRALWGDPLMEFYFRSLSGASAAWHEAYRQACEAAGVPHPLDRPGAERCLALYELYLGLVMVIEVAYRGFGPDHDAWVRDYCDRAWRGRGEK